MIEETLAYAHQLHVTQEIIVLELVENYIPCSGYMEINHAISCSMLNAERLHILIATVWFIREGHL